MSASKKSQPKWINRNRKRRALAAKRPWYKRTRTWVAGISTPIVVASLTAVIVPWEQRLAGPDPAGAPSHKASDGGGGAASRMSSAPQLPDIRVAVERDPNRVQSFSDIATQDYLIPKGSAIGNPPFRESYYDFAGRLDGVPVNTAYIGITLQNLSGGAVYLKALRAVDLKYGPALKGTRILWRGGAEPEPPRATLIDLDAARPGAWYFPRGIPSDSYRSGNSSPHFKLPSGNPPKGSAPFGFKLGKNDSETFDIAAFIAKRSCRFGLVIDAVVNGSSVEIRISKASEPIKVTGDHDDNVLTANPNNRWQSSDGKEIRPGKLPITDP